jgi:hypothetical protein
LGSHGIIQTLNKMLVEWVNELLSDSHITKGSQMNVGFR